MCIHSAFLGTLHILVVSPAATGSSAKLRERHEGDDAVTVSNVRSGLFKLGYPDRGNEKGEGEEATESPLRNLTFCWRRSN